jgi:hypothetical protein
MLLLLLLCCCCCQHARCGRQQLERSCKLPAAAVLADALCLLLTHTSCIELLLLLLLS